MPHDVDQLDLVGSREIADRCGLAFVETVHNWRQRYDDFPAPIASLSAGYVWSWADVRAWAEKTGRSTVTEGSQR
ncbi:MAG: DNA-binding protein [Solirubrobacteraceae bacterium]